MLLIFVRTILIYGLIVFAMRIMGKKQLGELQPSELVSTILISNLASISIESTEIPLVNSVVPVLIIIATEIFISIACVKSRRTATLISGNPRIIISKGELDQKVLFELRFTIDDLLEALRQKDVFEFTDVDFAIVETNGTISVKVKDETAESDAKIPSLPIIVDGNICKNNMKYCNVDEKFIAKQCENNKCEKTDVLLMLCNDLHNVTVIKKMAST